MSDDTMAPTTPQQAPEGGPELRDRRSVLRCAALVARCGEVDSVARDGASHSAR